MCVHSVNRNVCLYCARAVTNVSVSALVRVGKRPTEELRFRACAGRGYGHGIGTERMMGLVDASLLRWMRLAANCAR